MLKSLKSLPSDDKISIKSSDHKRGGNKADIVQRCHELTP